MRKGIVTLVAALLVVALPLTVSAAMLKVGDPHIPFKLPTHDGQTVDSADLAGKGFIVLNFMNTVCSTCATELVDAQKIIADRKDVMFYPVAVDMRGDKTVPEYRASNALTYTFLLDPKFAVARQYGASSTPYTVIIDKTGKITAMVSGYDDDVKAQIKNALK